MVTCSSWLGSAVHKESSPPSEADLTHNGLEGVKAFASHREATPGYLRGGRGKVGGWRHGRWQVTDCPLACPVWDKMIRLDSREMLHPYPFSSVKD